MATPRSLLDIILRIQSKVKSGMDNYDVSMTLIKKRAQIAQQYSSMLLGIIPNVFDPNDPIECAIIDDIRKEAEMNNILAGQIKNEILTPNEISEKTQREKVKILKKYLEKDIDEIGSLCNALDKHEALLESETSKCSTLDGEKLEKKKKYCQKLNDEYKTKLSKAIEVSSRQQSRTTPMIHSQFIEFDSNRLKVMHKSSSNYTRMRNQISSAQTHVTSKMLEDLESYDIKDKTERTVQQLFDPNKKMSPEEKEIIVTAETDFYSEEPGDLCFEKGDKIRVLLMHTSGWWDGECNGKRGMFPKSYVTPVTQSVSSSTSIATTVHCILDHKPQAPGEIIVLAGDLVYIDYMFKEKCTGVNLRTKERGSFPTNVLDIESKL